MIAPRLPQYLGLEALCTDEADLARRNNKNSPLITNNNKKSKGNERPIASSVCPLIWLVLDFLFNRLQKRRTWSCYEYYYF